MVRSHLPQYVSLVRAFKQLQRKKGFVPAQTALPVAKMYSKDPSVAAYFRTKSEAATYEAILAQWREAGIRIVEREKGVEIKF